MNLRQEIRLDTAGSFPENRFDVPGRCQKNAAIPF